MDGGDRGHADFGESPDRRHELVDQLASRRLVATEEDFDVRPCREVVTLGTHQDRARSAVTRLAGGACKIARELEIEQVQGRIVEHDLSDLPFQPELRLGHCQLLSGP